MDNNSQSSSKTSQLPQRFWVSSTSLFITVVIIIWAVTQSQKTEETAILVDDGTATKGRVVERKRAFLFPAALFDYTAPHYFAVSTYPTSNVTAARRVWALPRVKANHYIDANGQRHPAPPSSEMSEIKHQAPPHQLYSTEIACYAPDLKMCAKAGETVRIENPTVPNKVVLITASIIAFVSLIIVIESYIHRSPSNNTTSAV